MAEKTYCFSCEQQVDSEIRVEKETRVIRDEPISLDVEIRYCLSCGEQMWDTAIDRKTIILFYDEYKRKHGLLTSAEIRSLREGYNLSQSAFARILGVGEKTITRYENGAIQDEAINNLMLLVRKASNFHTLWNKSKRLLSYKDNECIRIALNNGYIEGMDVARGEPAIYYPAWKPNSYKFSVCM